MSKLKLITNNLIDTIEQVAEEASEIYILTSFVMRSGVKKLLPALQKAAVRGADIHIGTGDYLHITQPDALQLFVDELPEANVRMWQSGGRSFHPKAYLFRLNDEGHVIVGSSNMSASALTSGIEWNVSAGDRKLFETALAEFEAIFYHDHTIPVNTETVKKYGRRYDEFHRRQSVAVQWTDAEEESMMLEGPSDQAELIVEMKEPYTYKLTPRPVQQEALAALHATMDEQYERALVVMATGLGKTYLAAFFAKRFKRILFIAHREEILEQAKTSFLHVHRDRTAGILNGTHKEKEADMIFASVFTLNSNHHLHSFQPDDFDLIVIDEFHHAASKSYEKIGNYFIPQFFLGITATPDRMDNKDVYSICDGNVAYRIHFLEAIQKHWLAPFHYYGVYDDTDYSSVTWLGTRYDEEELLAVQMRMEMADNILQAWLKHKQTRTIGFCSSIKQADFLSRQFNEKGYKTVALHSQTTIMTRSAAIKALDKGQLDMIFTVDLFNEGVDIPSVDTILFVRPTESLTVFTQQIGRGLRIADGKTHCVMIDLIGNYRNADVKMSVFDTDPSQKKKGTIPAVPEHCLIDFELKAIELLTEMSRKRNPRKEQLHFAYEDLKLELGRRPTYLEFHLKANADSKAIKEFHKSYSGFLFDIGELNEQEEAVFKKHVNWFNEVEKTGMNKSYKMVLLQYMLERGPDHWTKSVTPVEVAPFFHEYLTSKEYRKRIDFSDKQGKRLWQYDEKAVAKLIADMPMTKWSGSSNELVVFDGKRFKVDVNIEEKEKEIIFAWTKEICKYRLHRYFERKAENIEQLHE